MLKIFKDGKEIQDVLDFNKEEGWYKINKRDAGGFLQKKNGEQVTLRIYENFYVEEEDVEEEVEEEEAYPTPPMVTL